MPIDPIALKKKISKMSTELGAFAVLSSLLLYLTDLISKDSQVQSKKVKWLEDTENKMNLKRKCQGGANSIRPTKFQLLQSRFMNSNREPYRKRGREVGKLIMKEKQPANRNGLNSIASKLDRNSIAEVSPKLTPQEKVRCGKNTVKNILKKFLAAEEKEAKEKQLTPQKKAPDNNLPKIINRKFVMSKLKEKFEQTSNICSAIEVKPLLPGKGKQKDKKVLMTKAIHKAEIRELQMDLRTASNIDSLECQHLVCTTVPLPKFHVATEISHPWSWTAIAKCTIQPCDHSIQVRETSDSQNSLDIHPDENGMSVGLAQGQQKGQLQNKHHEMPKVMTDGKDIAEMDVMSASPGPSLDSCPLSCKNEPVAESISPTVSKDSVDYKKTIIPVESNASSGSGDKNAGYVINKENLSSTCDSSNLTEGPNARHGHQDIKGGGIPGITEGMFRPQETEIEFTEPIKDHPFASQKCFPEQKAVENIPPFRTPVVQATCNTESPVDDLLLSVEPAAVDKTPPLKPSQRNAQDVRMKFCGVLQKREKLSKKEQTFSNCPVPTTERITKAKQKETSPEGNQGKIPETESEQLPQNPQIQPLICQPINLDDSSPNTSIQNTSQVNQASAPDRSHADNAGNISYDFEKHHSPLSHDLVTYDSATAEENTGKAKACSADKRTGSENNNEKGSLSQIDASQMLSDELITHKTQIPEQNPWPDSEKCHPPSLDHSERPEGHIAEVNRPRCSSENLETPSLNDLTKNEIAIREDKVPSQDSDKHHSSSNKLLTPSGITGSENKTVCNLTSDENKNENNATEGKDTIRHQTPKHEPSSSREFRKPENNTARKANPLCNTERHPMPPKKVTGKKMSLEEEKSEKKSLPSQNEMVIQQKHNNDAGGRDLQETVKHLIPVTADKKEQVEESSGDNKWIGDKKVVPYNCDAGGRDLKKTFKHLVPITVDKKEQVDESTGDNKWRGDKKGVPYSKPRQKSIKSDLTKNADDATNTNLPPSFEPQHLPPLKHNINDQELIHSPGNLKYQMPPSEPVKHGSATTGDENTGKYQGSSPKGPMKHEGGSGEDKLTKKTTPSSRDKEKSENKTRKKGENRGNLGQSQFSFKKGLPKNTGVDWNVLGDLKKDEIPSNEVKLKQLHPAAKKQQKPALSDSGNAKAIAKDDKQTSWHSKNFQPPSSDVKLEKQQQPQPSKDYVKPQTSVRDRKHIHPNSEKYSLPSEALDLHKKNASGKKGSMSNIEEDKVPLLNHHSVLEKEIEHKNDTDSANKSSPSNQRNTQHSSGKYQILSPNHVSGPETSETQKCQASAGDERKGRLVGLEKYIAESYSEGPLTLSFKPLVVRAIDTIKLDN